MGSEMCIRDSYEAVHLRDDLHAYSQLLFLLIQYDLANYDLVDYRLTNSERFLKNTAKSDDLQRFIIQLLRQLLFPQKKERKAIFKQALDHCKLLQNNPYLRRSFAYLDVSLWLEHKISCLEKVVILERRANG